MLPKVDRKPELEQLRSYAIYHTGPRLCLFISILTLSENAACLFQYFYDLILCNNFTRADVALFCHSTFKSGYLKLKILLKLN